MTDEEKRIEEKVTPAVNAAANALLSHNLTYGETLLAVQTMAAHIIAQREKSLENEFIKRLKKDILGRRIEKAKVEKNVQP